MNIYTELARKKPRWSSVLEDDRRQFCSLKMQAVVRDRREYASMREGAGIRYFVFPVQSQ